MNNIREDLWELRRLRLRANYVIAKACECSIQASANGAMESSHSEAGSVSAALAKTGLAEEASAEIPSANQGFANTAVVDAIPEDAAAAIRQADALWNLLRPIVETLPVLCAHEVFRLYYNEARSWANVCGAVKRGESAVLRLHREGLLYLESEG
ncbi:MAG: hypothetical protein RSE58_12535 [Clostridia bacterium]